MPIYTKKGDSGTSSLIDGTIKSKDHLIFACIGSIDELNSHIGITRTTIKEQNNPQLNVVNEILASIQQNLFEIGSGLAGKPHQLTETTIENMEKIIDHFQGELPPLKNFILPGGSRAGAECHIARTVCRRLERLLVSLHLSSSIDPMLLKYFNRLSDLLFVLARKINSESNQTEDIWSND